jgi:hypothetical protein
MVVVFGRRLLASSQERCESPNPIRLRQTSEALPSPTISSIPLFKPQERASEVGHAIESNLGEIRHAEWRFSILMPHRTPNLGLALSSVRQHALLAVALLLALSI